MTTYGRAGSLLRWALLAGGLALVLLVHFPGAREHWPSLARFWRGHAHMAALVFLLLSLPLPWKGLRSPLPLLHLLPGLILAAICLQPLWQVSRVTHRAAENMASLTAGAPQSAPGMVPLAWGSAMGKQVSCSLFTLNARLPTPYRLYRPDAFLKPLPVIVLFPPLTSLEHQVDSYDPFCRALSAKGLAVLLWNPRWAARPTFDKAHKKALEGLAWLAAEGPRLGLDVSNPVIAGWGTGGQLALGIAYGREGGPVSGVAAFHPVTDPDYVVRNEAEDSPLRTLLHKLHFTGGEVYTSAPRGRVRLGMPPTLLIHSREDDLFPVVESWRLAKRLERYRAPALLVDLGWGFRGIELKPAQPAGAAAVWLLSQFTLGLSNQAP